MKDSARLWRDTIVSIACIVLSNTVAFYGTRLLNFGLPYHDPSIWLDASIPFVPAWSIIYVLAFVQWGGTYLLLAREGRELCWRYTLAYVIAKLIAMLVFLLYPTHLPGRPTPEGQGLFALLMRLIYAVDQPNNLLPSLHCVESWLSLRIVARSKQVPGWLKGANALLTLLVLPSVVLVKQHSLLDIPAGLLTAELSLTLALHLTPRRPIE